MATVVLSPQFGNGYQGFSTNGVPLAGGLLNSYAAGTSTPTATYTTSGGTVQNANPIVLDSAGRTPSEVWLIQGTAYKFVLTDSLGSIQGTWDNIPGINDATALQGTLSTIAVSGGGTGQTTTNAALDALHFTEATVTAAATLNLDTVSSSYVQVLGNTAITAVTLTNGRERTIEFASTVAISSNSVLILPGGTTITAVAGDTMILRGEAGAVVRAVTFQPGNFALVGATQVQQEAGTVTTAIVTPGRQQYHPSAAKAWGQIGTTGAAILSYNVASVADGGTGLMVAAWTQTFSSVSYASIVAASAASGVRSASTVSQTVTSATYSCYDSSNSLVDPIFWNIALFGDQP